MVDDPQPKPLDTVVDAIGLGSPSDPEFGALCGAVFAYLVGPAPAAHVAMFMSMATVFRDQLRAKDLAYKAQVFLRAYPNPTQSQLIELAKMTPDQAAAYFETLGRDEREEIGKVIDFRGPRAVPTEAAAPASDPAEPR